MNIPTRILINSTQLCDVEGVLVKVLSAAPSSPHHLITIINNFFNKHGGLSDAAMMEKSQQDELKQASLSPIKDLKAKLSQLIDPVFNINSSSSSSVALTLLKMLESHSVKLVLFIITHCFFTISITHSFI